MPENFDIRRERIESDKDFERALRPMVMMRSVFHWARQMAADSKRYDVTKTRFINCFLRLCRFPQITQISADGLIPLGQMCSADWSRFRRLPTSDSDF